MNNKIKKGDKVRVSKDTPKLYTEGWSCNWLDCDLCVMQIDGDAAEVARTNDDDGWLYLRIPCKYLVKVEAEAKEATTPTIKVGDRVKIKRECLDCNKPIDDTYTFSVIPSEVVMIERDMATLYMIDSIPPKTLWARVDVLEPYTEPTEQTEAEKEPCVGCINFAERIKRQQEAHQAIVDEFRDKPFDWDAYTADLAKELAIAYDKRGESPLDAVAVAKEITKRLRQK